jgi:hypothetical protein
MADRDRQFGADDGFDAGAGGRLMKSWNAEEQ